MEDEWTMNLQGFSSRWASTRAAGSAVRRDFITWTECHPALRDLRFAATSLPGQNVILSERSESKDPCHYKEQLRLPTALIRSHLLAVPRSVIPSERSEPRDRFSQRLWLERGLSMEPAITYRRAR